MSWDKRMRGYGERFGVKDFRTALFFCEKDNSVCTR